GGEGPGAGARAWGVEDRRAPPEAGKRPAPTGGALAAPRLPPLYEPLSHLVYAAKGTDVRHSVVEGRVVLRDRKLTTLDEASVVAEADRWKRAIQESLKGAPR